MSRLIDISSLSGCAQAPSDTYTVFGAPEILAEMPNEHRDQILFLIWPQRNVSMMSLIDGIYCVEMTAGAIRRLREIAIKL